MEQPQSLAVFGTKPNKEGTSADQMSEGEWFWGVGFGGCTASSPNKDKININLSRHLQ